MMTTGATLLATAKDEEPTKAGRYSQAAVAVRRRALFTMIAMRGRTVTEAAGALQISRRTATRDLGAVRAELRKSPGMFDPRFETGLLLRKYEMVSQRALQEFEAAPSPTAKAAFLSVARKALDARKVLLQEIGVIPRL